MSGRQSLAGAFAPIAPARGAALQGLLPSKRVKSTPESGANTSDSAEASAQEIVQVPQSATPDAAGRGVPAEQPQADKRSAEQETVEEAPLEATGMRSQPTSRSTKTPKATTRHQAAKKSASANKASELVPGALRNVGVYLPPELLVQVKDAVYKERSTYADLLIDAFEAVDDEQIAKEFTPETSLTRSGIPRRAPRKRGEAGIQIQLRLDGLQVAWLDEKVTEFNAPSRSALVSVAFKLHMKTAQPVD